ncbi:MAG: s-methyl-5-thioribose-1-phosphate isomerase [Halobacteria archaeon]
MRAIQWDPARNGVDLVDQTLLPAESRRILCSTIDSLVEAIRSLRVRGAPALEAAGAYGVVLAAREARSWSDFESLVARVRTARPTAVNLSRGVERALAAARRAREAALRGEGGRGIGPEWGRGRGPRRSRVHAPQRERRGPRGGGAPLPPSLRGAALAEANRIADEDVARNRAMGALGAKLLRDGDTVMTHCNAGRLATVDYGTALGVLRAAKEAGRHLKVVACETRPLNQGARLTTYELLEDGFDVTLITDSMAGAVLRSGRIARVIVGADRITRDAVFNKIGTYGLACLAKTHKVPFTVAAPLTTFDLELRARDVPVEERDRSELLWLGSKKNAPDEVRVFNPAFDATPLKLVDSIVTEKGILRAPWGKAMAKVGEWLKQR